MINARSFCVGGTGVNGGSPAITTGVVAFGVLAATTVFLLVDARREAVNRERVARIEQSFWSTPWTTLDHPGPSWHPGPAGPRGAGENP